MIGLVHFAESEKRTLNRTKDKKLRERAHAELFLFLFLYCRVRCFLIAAVTAAVGVGRSRSVSVVNDLAAGYQFLNTCLFQHILKLVSRSKYDLHPTNRVGIHCRFCLLAFAADAGTELTEITQLYGNTFV